MLIMASSEKKNHNHKHKIVKVKVKMSWKNLLLYGFLFLFGLFLFIGFTSSFEDHQRVPLSDVIRDVKSGKVTAISVSDTKLTITEKGSKTLISNKESSANIYQIFRDAGVPLDKTKVEVRDDTGVTNWLNIASSILPIVLMIAFFYFLFRQAAKQELTEIVDFLKNPGKYKAMGARTPKGVLMIGPSGTGKTLLARATAGEAGVAFFSMAGSEFMEMLVGVGASRVRDLFSTAKKAQPAIIFIDEIDAIGRQRGVGLMGGHDEREQTLNQILVEMDGFAPTEQLVVMAATNRPDVLDPALIRPGRFDRRVMLDMPDREGRKAILAIHAKGKPFEANVNWEKVAKRTVGFSGADLENMLNEAAILAARLDKKAIDMEDLEEAATKVKLGPEKKRLQSDEDKRITAYHEAGHAMVGWYMPHMDPVHRISIVSRGMSLGHTMYEPTEHLHETKTYLLEQLAAMMGGRAAEELFCDEITSGAANDIETATRVARTMVVEFGMSSLGPLNLETQKRYMYEKHEVSPQMLAKIDEEVRAILEDAHKKAITILKGLRPEMDKVAAALMQEETMEAERFIEVVGPKKLEKETGKNIKAVAKA